RNRWASVQEMIERFRGRPPFDSWNPAVLRDYCQYGLLPDGDGFRLACPPDVEVSIYNHSNAPESNLYGGIERLPQPVTILRAAKPANGVVLEPASSPTGVDLASHFLQGRDVYLPERNHFIPMDAPELVADEIGHLD